MFDLQLRSVSYLIKGIFPLMRTMSRTLMGRCYLKENNGSVFGWGREVASNYFYFQEEEEEPEGKPSDAESSESSDDEKDWVEEVRKQRRLLQQEERARRQERLREDQQTVLRPQFYEIKAGEEFRSFKDSATKQKLAK